MPIACANPECPVEFTPKRANQKYCTDSCRDTVNNSRKSARNLQGMIDDNFRAIVRVYRGLGYSRMVQIIKEETAR